MESYNYSMVRVNCNGKIKSCEFCKEDENNKMNKEGYCVKCGRPLWKKEGESCNFIIGYLDRNFHQKQKVHFRCRYCNSITTV